MSFRLIATPQRTRRWCVRLAVGVAAGFHSVAIVAQDSYFAAPLPMNNRTPFTLVFIAPTAPDATLLSGEHQLSGHVDLSSHSLSQTNGDTRIELDGESLRLALAWQYRPAERWIVRAELPWVSHNGGFLDDVIDRWHNLTGLPEGQRNRQPDDRLLFAFQNDRQTLVTTRHQQDLGDVMLSTAFRLHNTSQRASAQNNWHQHNWIQLSIKLPTGSADHLSGSEATDVAVSFHHNWQHLRSSKPWSLSVDAYAIHTGQSKVIESQRKTQWQLSVKAALEWTDRIGPELQLRYRSAAYDSPVAVLGGDSLGLDVGVTVSHDSGYWKLGFNEDLDVDSAPDIGFYLQYTHR